MVLINFCWLFFIGIIFILLKEKEGFGHAINDAYNGAFLSNYLTNPNPQEVLALNKQQEKYINKLKEINTLKNIEKETNNIKYPKIPCSHENYDYGICNALI